MCPYPVNNAKVIRWSLRQPERCFRRAKAFSVIELMLSVAILGVIIFALYSVFNQTQKALRSTQTQGDVAEKGRAIFEMIGRELEQAQPTFSAIRNGTNIQSEINILGGFEYGPLTQKAERLDIQPRTNFLHNLFFFNNKTNAWQGIGYRVVNVTNGVGVLVRFETNHFGYRPVGNVLSGKFKTEPHTNSTYHHVADGVIHMAFTPYDSQGFRLGYDTTNRLPGYYRIYRTSDGALTQFSDVNNTNIANVTLQNGYKNPRAETLPYASVFAFSSNAMPSYIEMEFGILEPETLTQYYTMLQDQNPNATNFLARQVAKVHLFRERIPIRTAAQ